MTKQLKLDVSGMSCGHCVHAVREALGTVPGVTVEEVQIGSATVSLDEDKATVGTLLDAISDAGYEASEAA
ncbi:MAG TPA: cation transporter [Gemmatimonadaceae bacterium]